MCNNLKEDLIDIYKILNGRNKLLFKSYDGEFDHRAQMEVNS